MDRHKLWRRVAYDFEQLAKIAPEGYEPTVEVFVVGREAPVSLGFVETRRGDDDPWVRFESSKGIPREESAAKPTRDVYWLHVHENYVQRVEIRFRRSGEFEFGFRYSVAPEDTGDE